MSSRLRTLIRQMESALRESGLQRELARARPLEPFLEDFADAGAILDAFADQRAETYPIREALTRAVIGARQKTGSTQWSSVLMVAYFPMLSRLRHRIWGNPMPAEDLDQLVLMAFLQFTNGFRLERWPDRTALRIRQGTARILFMQLGRVQRQKPLCRESVDVLQDCADPEAEAALAEVEDQAILRSAARRLAVLLDGDLRNDDFEIVVSTTLYGKTIKAAVEDLVGHTLDTPGTVYQRYKKRHYKALRRAQKRMAEVDLEHDELGPLFVAAGLLPPEEAEAGAMA